MQPTYLNNTGNNDVSWVIISFTLCELNFLLTLILVRKKNKIAVSSADDLNRVQMSLNILTPPPPPTATATHIDWTLFVCFCCFVNCRMLVEGQNFRCSYQSLNHTSLVLLYLLYLLSIGDIKRICRFSPASSQ